MSQLFKYQSKEVRTLTENNEIWFAAKDVCSALNIDWSGKTLAAMPICWQRMGRFPMLRGKKELKLISEPAVYKLAFRSNKPEADAFTNWVASEVLPAIRRSGQYQAALEQPKLALAQAAIEQERLPLYHNGYFSPPSRNKRHIAGEREAALMDCWNHEFRARELELEHSFRSLLSRLDSAVGDLYSHAVSDLGKETDTMFSVTCIQERLYTARDMADECFKDALGKLSLHLRMAANVAVALGR